MNDLVRFLILAAAGYLLGSFNAAIVVSKGLCGYDIRQKGSGNAGLTNAYRVMGGGKTALVFLGDVAKGVVGVSLGGLLLGPLGKLLAGVFVILGHVFPLYFGFRGGKGVLVGGVLLLVFDWRVFVVAIALFLLTVLLSRYVSLGSILAAVSFPITTWYFYREPLYTALTAAVALAVIYLHRANIGRLLRGRENKFSLHGKRSDS